MLIDSIKIRVPWLMDVILREDASAFGFVKNNNDPNLNDFINKIIPNLLKRRKEKRKKINDKLAEIFEFYPSTELPNRTRELLTTLVDDINYSEINNWGLDENVIIRPTTKTITEFKEIITEETKIMQTNVSAYIRNMLNEYIMLSRYERIKIVFTEELDLIEKAYRKENLFNFTYDGLDYSVAIYQVIPDPVFSNNILIIAHDFNKNIIASFLLHKIKVAYTVEVKENIYNEEIQDKVDIFVSSGQFFTDSIFSLEEN
ncbi:MAG: hypothetical protein ACOX24_06135 [Christensenellales bacterium]|jgi:hypothetical protein|nr:hypothetical protein [Clostridiales bacterium]